MATAVMEDRQGRYTVMPYKRTWLPSGHDGEVLFTGTEKGLVPEFSYSGRCYVTGLTNDEARALEKELNLKPDELSPFNKEYWSKFHIPVGKGGVILDLSRPQDYLTFKVLKASSLVITSRAESETERGLFAECIMLSEEKEAAVESKKIMQKKEAYDRFGKMSAQDMKDFLMVFPKTKMRVSDSHNIDFLNKEVGKIVDEDPVGFMAVLKDPHYQGKLFVEQCITNKSITRDGHKYYITGDVEPFALGLPEAVEYLYNPSNQGVLISLKAKSKVNE